MSSPFKKETGWRTNRRTKKPFPNPLGSDLDRGRSKVEEAEDQSDVQQDESFYCIVCLQEKTGSHFTINGEDCCAQCLSDYKSGRMQAEDTYERAKQIYAPVVNSGSRDMEHTYHGSCAGCGSTRRSLCPHCSRCYPCRGADCPRKR